MFLPFRTKNPPESLPIATVALILINTAIFFATQSGLEIKPSVIEEYGLTKADMSPLTLVSSMFLHGDLLHLIGNMLFLWIFGLAVEGRLKTPLFLLVYLASGLAGDFLHLGLMGPKFANIPLVGASGAIMGVMGAALYMFPHAPITFLFVNIAGARTIDWPLWGAALMYIAFDILGAMINLSGFGGTAHLAHLGGVAAGFLLVFIFRIKRDDEHVSEAKATLHETKDYSTLTRMQLGDLAKLQPDNPEIALYWMEASLRQNSSSIPPECVACFTRNLPTLVRDGKDLQTLAAVIGTFGQTPGAIAPGYLITLSLRLEKEGKPQNARQLLEAVRKDPKASEQDRETATFRLAGIAEQWNQQWDVAASLYREFLQKYPMSPFAGTAQSRLKYLENKIASQPTQPTAPSNPWS